MKLHEGLKSCIDGHSVTKERGIYPHIKMRFNTVRGRFEMSLDEQSFRDIKGLDWKGYEGDWQLHSDPKFKVGDLVGVPLIDDKLVGVVKSVDGYKVYLFGYEDGEYCFDGNLTLIMPAEELAEKLGGSE